MNLVTGGTGLVGAHLLFDLVKSGEQVRAIKRNTSDLQWVKKVFEHYAPGQDLFSQIEWMEGDTTDVLSLESALNGVDFCYHAAAMVSFLPEERDAMMKVNIEGTANVVNVCLAKGVKKLGYVSSVAALGKSKNGELVDENTAWKAGEESLNYSISKHYSENEVWRGVEEGLPAVIVNPCLIIGPGNWHTSSAAIINKVWKGLSFYTTGSNGYVDARDVSGALIQLMKTEISGEKYLLVSENMKFKTFFDMLAQELGKPKPWIKANPALGGLAWRTVWLMAKLSGRKPFITRETMRSALQNIAFSNQKIKDAIDYDFISVSQSVKEVSQAFLSQYDSR